MEKIRIEELTFKYPLSEKNALEGISFSIGKSEFVAVCGKSGCGKSTLLRHMKKSMIPYGEKKGKVLIDGISVEEQDDRLSATKIGFVQQNPDNQLVTDKVWHELAFGLENLGYSNAIIKRRVAEMASYFGIQNWFRMDVADLSGGQKQLLNLASVMAMQPEILILDEPASQLDPLAATEFLNTVYRINRDLGTTVILSEHRLEEVFPMADQVLVLDEGHILTKGNPRTVATELASIDNGKPHPMFHGMPHVIRIFAETDYISESNLPLTVREGRLLLDNIIENSDFEKPGADSAPYNETQSMGKENYNKGEDYYSLLIRDVFFKYEKSGKHILRGINLNVKRGTVNCLLGGNGSGKSTLLKTIIGIEKPQRGKITIAEGEKIALVPQDPQALFTEITVEEEMYEGMAFMDLTEEEKIQNVEKMLVTMGIAHLAKANPYDLSGGEQQRLAIGKVMTYGPTVLLLDEPTKGLDPFFKITLGNILRGLAETGTTIFMVSHDIDFCASYGDICSMIFDGEISATGSSHEFFRGNSFYTTTANKLTRKWRNDLVLSEEVRDWLLALNMK